MPLQKTLKQWSDRRKTIYEPLFRSYVFVRVDNTDYMEALTVPGIVRYVTIAGERIPIPNCQIEAVKTYLGEISLQQEISYFSVEDEVEVAYGALRGLRGKLLSAKDQRRLIVRIDAINQNITLTLPAHLLKKI